MKNSIRKESGAVLITGLIILIVMTLLVISLVRTAILQLKIGGYNQAFVSNLEAAQTFIDQYIGTYSAGRRFAKDCESISSPQQNQTSCQPSLEGANTSYAFTLGDQSRRFYPISNEVSLTVVSTGCLPGGTRGDGSALGQGAANVFFQITGKATSKFFGGRTILDQGVVAKGPATVCDYGAN